MTYIQSDTHRHIQSEDTHKDIQRDTHKDTHIQKDTHKHIQSEHTHKDIYRETHTHRYVQSDTHRERHTHITAKEADLNLWCHFHNKMKFNISQKNAFLVSITCPLTSLLFFNLLKYLFCEAKSILEYSIHTCLTWNTAQFVWSPNINNHRIWNYVHKSPLF